MAVQTAVLESGKKAIFSDNYRKLANNYCPPIHLQLATIILWLETECVENLKSVSCFATTLTTLFVSHGREMYFFQVFACFATFLVRFCPATCNHTDYKSKYVAMDKKAHTIVGN